MAFHGPYKAYLTTHPGPISIYLFRSGVELLIPVATCVELGKRRQGGARLPERPRKPGPGPRQQSDLSVSAPLSAFPLVQIRLRMPLKSTLCRSLSKRALLLPLGYACDSLAHHNDCKAPWLRGPIHTYACLYLKGSAFVPT